jgi:hypothetical protein
LIGIVARYRRRDFFLRRERIETFNENGVRLNTDILDLRPFVRREGEILLAKDVLDKQLIDVDGKRVVRVNDVLIIDVGYEWRVTGADVSFQGFMRRLMPTGFYGSNRPVEVIDWADVGYLATDFATVQLKSARGKLSRLHPVEIAQLAESLAPYHRTEIVEALDDETAAEALEEMRDATQAQIIGELDEERAADILEWMSPDEAADVLGDLPEEKAEELLGFSYSRRSNLTPERNGRNAKHDLLHLRRRRGKFVAASRSHHTSRAYTVRPVVAFRRSNARRISNRTP